MAFLSLSGIPIDPDDCIGDSLQTINAAFTALDFRTSFLVSGGGGAVPPVINMVANILNLGTGSSTVTVSGDSVTTGNATISGDLIVGGNTFLGKDCSKKTTIKGTLSLPCTGQNVIEFNGENISSGAPITDGAVIQYQPDLFGAGKDGLLFEKTSFPNATPDGGIAFRNRGTIPPGAPSVDQAFAIRGDGKVGINTFYPNKALTVIGEISATQDLTVNGNTILGSGTQTTTVKNKLNVEGDVEIDDDLIVKGDLTVLGDTTQLDTLVYATSALSVTNHGSGPALQAKQLGNQPVAHFFDDAATALFIDGTTSRPGWVGIKTSTPRSELEVAGDVTLQENHLSFRHLKIADSAPNSTDLKIDATNHVLLQSSLGSYVGIKRNDPHTELDVNGDITITDKIIHRGDNNTNIRFPADDNFAIETNGAEAVRVISNGNVGINQTAPAAKLHVNGTVYFENNLTFNSPLSSSRRVTDLRPVSRDEILNSSIYDRDPVPVESLRNFLFDDPSSLIVNTNFLLRDLDHNRTYVCTNTVPITIVCPQGLRVGLQVSFIRGGTGEVSFLNGPGSTVDSALNFKKLAFQFSAGTVYLGQPNTYYLFGDLLP